MSVECYVTVLNDSGQRSPSSTPVFTFLQVPRIGESIALVLSGQPDDDGVYYADRYRVQDVLHSAAIDPMPASISVLVTLEQSHHESED